MRVTLDKNGDPFGYCEAECSQQMRIGGDARRVRKFLARFPWAAKAKTPEAGGSQVAAVASRPAVTVTAPVPAKKRGGAGVFDLLLGGAT